MSNLLNKDYNEYLYFNYILQDSMIRKSILVEPALDVALIPKSWNKIYTNDSLYPNIDGTSKINLSAFYYNIKNGVIDKVDNYITKLNTLCGKKTQTYRLLIHEENSLNIVLNLGYSDKYLKGDVKFTEDLKLDSKFWAETTPYFYMEMCTTRLNKVFYDITKLEPVSINNTNSICDQDSVDIACKIETKNPRCACSPYYENHSFDSMSVAKTMKNYDQYVNTDPWCLYADCAKGTAYKNRLDSRRSVCSNTSISGIFVDSAEYSSVNLNNVKVYATSSNENGINLSNIESFSATRSLETKKIVSKTNRKIINGTLLLLTIIFFVIFLRRTSDYNTYNTSVLIFFIVSFILSLIFYIELFLEDDVVVPEKFEETIKNNSCIIGYYKDANGECSLQNNMTCNTLPYLPFYVYTGIYYYTTVVDNVIFAFAQDCSFKYDENMWIELPKLPNQKGFHPYEPDYVFEKGFLTTNSNKCFTVGNKIYIITMSGTMFNYGAEDKGINVLCYDTSKNAWTVNNNDGDFFTIESTMIVKDSKVYILDKKYFRKYDLNLNTITNYELPKEYTYSANSYLAFMGGELYYFGNISPEDTKSSAVYKIVMGDTGILFFTFVVDYKIPISQVVSLTGNIYVQINDTTMAFLYDSSKAIYFDSDTFQISYKTLVTKGTGYNIFTDVVVDSSSNYILPVLNITCAFSLNNFIFGCNGMGDIFRVSNEGSILNFVPCLGIPKHSEPNTKYVL
jgi:hypothetical protein